MFRVMVQWGGLAPLTNDDNMLLVVRAHSFAQLVRAWADPIYQNQKPALLTEPVSSVALSVSSRTWTRSLWVPVRHLSSLSSSLMRTADVAEARLICWIRIPQLVGVFGRVNLNSSVASWMVGLGGGAWMVVSPISLVILLALVACEALLGRE